METERMKSILKEDITHANKRKNTFLFLYWALYLLSAGIGGWATVLQQMGEPDKFLSIILAAITTGLAGLANFTSFKVKYQNYRMARNVYQKLLFNLEETGDEQVPRIISEEYKEIKFQLKGGTESI